MFEKRDKKIQELEKRIAEMEKQVDVEIDELRKRTKEQIRDLGSSLRTLENVMKKIHDERNELERDRNFLLDKHKELIRQIPVDRSRLKRDIREKLLLPMHRKAKENAELIKDVALEGLEEEGVKPTPDAMEKDYIQSIKSAVVDEETKTPIDGLFEIVVKEGAVKIQDAARKFGVTEAQLEEWAKILESHGLIEIHYPPIGKPELRKKQQ